MNKNSQKGNTGIIVLLVIAVAALTGVSVYFWQNYEKEKALNSVKMSTNAADEPYETTPEETEEKPISAPASKTEAEVIFTPGGLFTQAEIAEVKKKFTDPFIDWNKEYDQTTVSITVEKGPEPVAGYKYEISYIFKGGGNGGQLFGTKTPLEWWIPECMGGCTFSDSFKAKYPEIVAQYK